MEANPVVESKVQSNSSDVEEKQKSEAVAEEEALRIKKKKREERARWVEEHKDEILGEWRNFRLGPNVAGFNSLSRESI